MSESTSSGLKALALIFGLAILALAGWELHQSGDLIKIVWVVVGVVCLALLILVGGKVAIEYRKAGHPPQPETHRYFYKERVLDGRQPYPPQVYQVRTPREMDLFPEAMEALLHGGPPRRRLPRGVTPAVRDPETGDPTRAGLGDIWDGQDLEEYEDAPYHIIGGPDPGLMVRMGEEWPAEWYEDEFEGWEPPAPRRGEK